MLRNIVQRILGVGFAALMTLAIFMVLPVMQTIGNPLSKDLTVRNVDAGFIEPPPPPPEQEMEEPEEEPEPPPELLEEAPPLELSQLELVLDNNFGDAGFGEFAINLTGTLAAATKSAAMDEIFSLDQLDQTPRVIFQRMPDYPAELRRSNKRGTVQVVFMVDKNGRVLNPKIKSSDDPAFERPALEAVRQWKFEPGTRNGEKVQFKMMIPITFAA